jgi:hypothetical protein
MKAAKEHIRSMSGSVRSKFSMVTMGQPLSRFSLAKEPGSARR